MLAAACTKAGAGAWGKSCCGPCSAVPRSPGVDLLHLALQRMLEQNPAAWHQAQALLALLELLCGSLLQSQPFSHGPPLLPSLLPVWRHLILAGSPRVGLARWCSSCVRVPAASAGSRGRAVASAEVTPWCATKEAVSSRLHGLWHIHLPLLWFLAVNEGEPSGSPELLAHLSLVGAAGTAAGFALGGCSSLLPCAAAPLPARSMLWSRKVLGWKRDSWVLTASLSSLSTDLLQSSPPSPAASGLQL